MRSLVFVFFLLASIGSEKLSGQTINEAVKFLENENYTAAMGVLNSLSSKEPKNGVVQYYIGEVKRQLEDNVGAEAAYVQGLKIDSKCYQCNVGLGKLRLDEGKTVEAKKLLEGVVKSNKKVANAHALVGNAYMTSTKPDISQAIIHLTSAKELDPKVARHWSDLGDAYKISGDMGKAMTNYEVSVEKDNTNIQAYMSMAKIWTSSRQEELAIEKLEAAIKLNPTYAPAYKDMYELYIKARKYDKVTPILDKYVSLTSSDIEAKVRLVKFLCFQAKDYKKAAEEGEKLIKTNPDQYTLYRWIAWSYAELDKCPESFENSKKLFAAAEGNASRKLFGSDYEYLAKCAVKIGKPDTAVWAFNKLIALDSTKSYEANSTLAKSFFDSKNYESSIKYYVKKGAQKPLANTDNYYLGLAYYYNKNYTPADSMFTKVVEATPNYAQGWWMKAKIADQMDTDEAKPLYLSKPYYEKYVEFGSADKERNKKNLIIANNYLASYYVQNNDNMTAKTYLQNTIDLDPANEFAVKAMAVLPK